MPIVTLTNITLRSLRPTPGKQVTYIDKSLKGFGVRVNERGLSYVLSFGPGRQRIKIANVGIVPLKDARTKAKSRAQSYLWNARRHCWRLSDLQLRSRAEGLLRSVG